MDAIGFAFAVGIPLGFLIWAMGFKGFFASLQLPPVIVLLFAVLTLNSNPVLTFNETSIACPDVPLSTSGTIITTTETRSTCYEVQTENFALPVHSLIPIRAEYASSSSSSIVDQTIECIDVPLRKFGNPSVSQLVNVGIFDNSGSLVTQFGSGLNVTTLTTSSTYTTFCLSSGALYTIASGDRIGIQYTGGDASNYVEVRGDSNNPFNGTDTHVQTFSSGAWSSQTTNDLRISLYRGINQTVTTQDITNTLGDCQTITAPVDHPVGPEAMLIVNYSMLSGAVSVFFISMYRIFSELDSRKQQRQA